MIMTLQFYHFHGYSVAVVITMEMIVTMDEQAELISLKYLRKHQLVSEGITLPSVVTKDTEVSMATQQYLQRHGLNSNTSVAEHMKPYNSSNDDCNDNNMVLDMKRLRSLPKLY